MRERLRDAAGVLATYELPLNHYEEDPDDSSRSIEHTATTSGTGFVRQQGKKAPERKRYRGTILRQEQFDVMRAYEEACETRTVFFRDYDGVETEVIITAFNPQRVAVARNPQGPPFAHVWRYTLEMEVIG